MFFVLPVFLLIYIVGVLSFLGVFSNDAKLMIGVNAYHAYCKSDEYSMVPTFLTQTVTNWRIKNIEHQANILTTLQDCYHQGLTEKPTYEKILDAISHGFKINNPFTLLEDNEKATKTTLLWYEVNAEKCSADVLLSRGASPYAEMVNFGKTTNIIEYVKNTDEKFFKKTASTINETNFKSKSDKYYLREKNRHDNYLCNTNLIKNAAINFSAQK
jgi:alpha-acetolactate decarboxylase